jgi:4-aminobutyrate aminotransferase-like enzyme
MSQDNDVHPRPHDPIKIDHAEGVWLYTDDGRKILDADAAASRERSL